MSPTGAEKSLGTPASPVAAPSLPAPPPAAARKYREPRYVVLCLLGVAMLVSIGGWIAMVLMDKAVPDGFPVVIGTVIGGLVGIAASDRPT
ncbi:hypothetical protein [Pseudofrankia inefficax]|uniref:Uncharacterized protein n=1 Tax=Pseudofrankia inefficax (strain DSM 45817 / CECT 9037 / DDB 130130 / EuI1c) TaxID=298654 RepID=E3J2M2_PSEI1|nr:hypothetical protein [Pseudofrankia inefficax]ADP80536.1 hypothetical protein FraEuI1c_2502 [Pseudofrankia inefficax]